MFRRLILFALALAAPLAAAQQRSFTIGGEAFREDEILDARGLPEVDGTPVVMITFAEDASQRFLGITRKHLGKPLLVAIDGRTVAETVIKAENNSGVLELPGAKSMDEAVALAKLISGKEPLPDELE